MNDLDRFTSPISLVQEMVKKYSTEPRGYDDRRMTPSELKVKNPDYFWDSLMADLEKTEGIISLYMDELNVETVKCTCEHEGMASEDRPTLALHRDEWQLAQSMQDVIGKIQRLRQRVNGVKAKGGTNG